nr:beta-adaptin-like protein C [Tanacetum cinerariifolium]
NDEAILAFKDFPAPHSGSALAKTLRNVFVNFNLENKIMSITLDNASNNTSAIDFEEEILDAEVQANEAIPPSDEKIALDAASSEGSMSGPGSGREEAEAEEVLKDIPDILINSVDETIERLASSNMFFIAKRKKEKQHVLYISARVHNGFPLLIELTLILGIVLSIEDKLNYLEQPIPPARVAPAGQQVDPEILAAYNAWIKGLKEIVGLMLMTMEPKIQ